MVFIWKPILPPSEHIPGSFHRTIISDFVALVAGAHAGTISEVGLLQSLEILMIWRVQDYLSFYYQPTNADNAIGS